MNKDTQARTITKNSYRWWGYLSDFLTYLTPILWITFKYNIFTNNKLGFTSWFWIIMIFVLGFLKSTFVKYLKEFNETFTAVNKRVIFIFSWVVVLILFFFFIDFVIDIAWIFSFYVLGLVLSLFPYAMYNKNKEYYDRIKKAQNKVNDEEDIKSGRVRVK